MLPQVISQLDEQGFEVIRVQRTWLGRVRVVSRSGEYEREIVYVPSTGEVLRDYWRPLRRQGGDGADRFDGGRGDDRDDRDDDRDDDNDDNDDDDDDSDDDDSDDGDDDDDDDD
ncbi:hypothetical protein HMH01_03140 [Halovulum dunhuangense]|uniref:PepSY domain-containing protein n=1 Tax=Halovulum dunhuangense TaxID=1505036 RepID=A0A849KZP5_9RHOB|nr:hypothetical protein [Halovulum dunhuangense]